MVTRAAITSTYPDEDLFVMDEGLDGAIVGIGERCGQKPVVIYDAEKVVRLLMESNGWDKETAQEFFDFNIAGAWLGEQTPVYLYRPLE